MTVRAPPAITDRVIGSPSIQRETPPGEQRLAGASPAVDTFERGSALEGLSSIVARRAKLPKPIALESRGPAGSEVRSAMDRMLARARDADVTIEGRSVQDFVRKYLLENPRVTNEQLLSMERVSLKSLQASDGTRERAHRIAPDLESLPSHRFGIGLFHAVTGLERGALSKALPDVGITGSLRVFGFGWIPKSTTEQQTTALHDFTDLMSQRAGVKLNAPVWGYADMVRSAAASYRGLPE